MKYDIMYRPVFDKKRKNLIYYEMMVYYPSGVCNTDRSFDVLTIETEKSEEFTRFKGMITRVGYQPDRGTSLVDKHPLEIINYLRGLNNKKSKRVSNWEEEIPEWRVDSKGNRVLL